jgi:hypothetical protein
VTVHVGLPETANPVDGRVASLAVKTGAMVRKNGRFREFRKLTGVAFIVNWCSGELEVAVFLTFDCSDSVKFVTPAELA